MTEQDESDLRDIEHALALGRARALEAVARLKRRVARDATSSRAPLLATGLPR